MHPHRIQVCSEVTASIDVDVRLESVVKILNCGMVYLMSCFKIAVEWLMCSLFLTCKGSKPLRMYCYLEY